MPDDANSSPPESGVHFAYLLDGQGGGRPLDAAAARAWTPDQGVLWILLDRSNPGAESWLRDVARLPELVREGLLAEDTRPRAVNTPEGTLAILRGVNCNPGAEPDDMVSIRLWLDPTRVISLRGRRVFAIDDLVNNLGRGVGPRSPGSILALLADALSDRMRDVVGNQEELVDGIEDDLIGGSAKELRLRLAVPRRQTMTIRRYLSPQRDMLSRLTTETSTLFGERDRVRLREVADELTRQVEELDLLRERSTMIQEQILAQASEQMNRTMYILSLVAAIFLPLGLITGLLGINVGGLPGQRDPHAFWFVCGALGVLAVVQWMIFKKHRLL
ncbi:MAG: zinc transporter ZntB [Phycisphaerales bacterium]|nr:zinc transporter ZntB [Phycisphaerales bacterium]